MAKNGDPFNHIGGLDVDSMLIWIGIYSVSLLYFSRRGQTMGAVFQTRKYKYYGMEENPRSSSCGSTSTI